MLRLQTVFDAAVAPAAAIQSGPGRDATPSAAPSSNAAKKAALIIMVGCSMGFEWGRTMILVVMHRHAQPGVC